MMTVRKRVGPLPTHHLAMRHLVDYSSSDHFSSDDSSSLSSETSSDSSVDALSDSASSHSSSDHSLPASPLSTRSSHGLCSLVPSVHRSSAAISKRPSHDYSSASSSCKRSRSPIAFVSLYSPIPRAFNSARADLRGLGVLRVDVKDESSEQSRSRGIDIDPEIQAEIDECIAYTDALRVRGIDTRVVVEAVDREEIKDSERGPVKVRVNKVTHLVIADDTPKSTQEGAIEAIESVQRDQGHRIIVTGQQSADMLGRIHKLERDNRRLRDIVDVASQRVTRSQLRKLRVQRELRQIRQLAAATRNLEPLIRDEGKQEEVNGNGGNRNGGNGNRGNGNGGNGNGGNGNGNGNGGGYGYNFGGYTPARECTYQDFLKYQPLNFNGTEGVVGLTYWFEKMRRYSTLATVKRSIK
ncbi:hypothetical protein Tco_0749760 [Tanacetum coccineum]|uniref:Reverse transcriptase domain-containing protein n=1 Tax=Tanacetum coccineum TaxID=301880 RepID=A0ABQ4YZE7_9ASTR